MAKAAKKKKNDDDEILTDDDIDSALEELDEELEDVETLDDEDEEDEDEVEEEEPKKSKKAKSTKAKPSRSRTTDGKIGTADIAAKAGVDARTLRMVLRKHEISKDEETGRYEWDSFNDKTVKKILKLLEGGEAEKVKKEGLDRLKATQEEKKAKKKKDKKKAKKKSKSEDDDE